MHSQRCQRKSADDRTTALSQNKTPRRPVTESFAEREKRHFAMEVLSSPDLLMMHALSEGDVSLPQFSNSPQPSLNKGGCCCCCPPWPSSRALGVACTQQSVLLS